MIESDCVFRSMGSEVRLLIGPPLMAQMPSPAEAAAREEAFVTDFARRLSRFRTDSELTHLNSDPRPEVPASRLLRAAVGAGLWAAKVTGGLVDPTLMDALESAGYLGSMDGCVPASLTEALLSAPGRRPARPDPTAAWRGFAVDELAGTIRRAPGLRFDTGGTGKGLCADAVARRLQGYTRYAVDCGGDITVGGIGAELHPYEIGVQHPVTGEIVGRVSLRRGGVATSGLNVRIWQRPDGSFAHHLLDPSTGGSAWSGLIGVTAVAASGALEAETLSKQALLLGPVGARAVLAEQGGVIIDDRGDVELVGPLDYRGSAVGTAVTASA